VKRRFAATAMSATASMCSLAKRIAHALVKPDFLTTAALAHPTDSHCNVAERCIQGRLQQESAGTGKGVPHARGAFARMT